MAIQTDVFTTFSVRIASIAFCVGMPVSLALFNAPAKASTFSFQATDVGHSGAGHHKLISTEFDTDTNRFSWSSTLTRNEENNRLADGGWLVVSDGPDPRADSQEYAIFYLDGNNNKVSAYDYSGTHRKHSWGSTTFLGETALNTADEGDQRTFSFSLDMSEINSRTDFGPDWKGTAFTDEIGIWFHSLDGLQTSYEDNGALSQFSYDAEGRYDGNSKPTVDVFADRKPQQEIPEPSIAVSLVGLLALSFRRHSRT